MREKSGAIRCLCHFAQESPSIDKQTGSRDCRRDSAGCPHLEANARRTTGGRSLFEITVTIVPSEPAKNGV
jgi:hypothetical protein